MKRDPYIRVTKVLFIMALINLGSFASLFAPHAWGAQFSANLGKAKLIEPSHEVIEELETKFFEWIDTEPYLDTNDLYALNYSSATIPYQYGNSYYIYSSVNFSESSWEDIGAVKQLMVLNYFITEEIIIWTSDSVVYGSPEYKGTVDQVLNISISTNWAEKSRDDCDGIAVVTVSLLQRLGYDAYIGSGRSHWYTVVEPRIEDNFKAPLFLNTWRSIHVYYYFNQEKIILGQPLIDTIKDIWLLDGIEPEMEQIMEFFMHKDVLIIGISLVVSIIGVLFVCYPRKHAEIVSEEIVRERNARKAKMSQNRFLASKKNPLNWIANITYVRVGNPFKKVYLDFWIDVVWTTIALFFVVKGFLGIVPTYFLYTYAGLTLWAIIFVLDGHFIPKLKEKIISLARNKKQRE